MAIKKFPLRRSGSSRKNGGSVLDGSERSSGLRGRANSSGGSDIGNDGYDAGGAGGGPSPRRSPFGGSGRKPSFRFGRRKKESSSSPSPPSPVTNHHSPSFSSSSKSSSPVVFADAAAAAAPTPYTSNLSSARTELFGGGGGGNDGRNGGDDSGDGVAGGGGGILSPPLPSSSTAAATGGAVVRDDAEDEEGAEKESRRPLTSARGRPPPTPRARSVPASAATAPSATTTSSTTTTTTTAAALSTSSMEPLSSIPPPLPATATTTAAVRTHTRSLTPSDYHYHTSPSGGCNAPLAPITHHYASNDALLDLFSTLYETGVNRDLEVAYAVGIKFVEVALFQIPKHGYYGSGRGGGGDGERRKRKSAADAVRVTRMLGGMVDEIMDGEEDGRGMEKVETLQKLATEAQRSLEKASAEDDDDDDGPNNVGDARKKRAGDAPQQHSWKDYIIGGGRGSENGDSKHTLCSSILPDNICSFWNLGRSSQDVVDDAVMEDDERERQAKKRPRVDRKSLPRPPEAVVIPQVFIKRDTMEEGEMLQEDPPVAKKVSHESVSDSETSHAEAAGTKAEEMHSSTKPVAQTKPGESQSGAGSMRTETLDDTPMEGGSEETKLATLRMVSNPVAVKGNPATRPQTDAEGFEKGTLKLALSRSTSMRGSGNIIVPVVSSSSEDAESPMVAVAPGGSYVGIASTASIYERRYHSLKEWGKFHVRFLDTFQGRNPQSTNGCTVIAPLTCVQYFTSREQNAIESASTLEEIIWRGGLPDDLINHVIDDHAAAILPEVRDKLNLGPDSFIIPSDVHDHLIDEGLLSTSQFVGVCGGNVLDDDHLSSFKRSLFLLDDERERKRLRGRKIGATFFFHGHVVALHVVDGGPGPGGEKDNDDDGVRWVEMIDSLPTPETWIRRPEGTATARRVSPDSSDCDEGKMMSRESSCEGEWETPMECDDGDGGDDDGWPMNAVRVRCTDIEHFEVLIRHYACSKFSDEEREFIDETGWDDVNGYCESSFDPRVFQAFIWCEAA